MHANLVQQFWTRLGPKIQRVAKPRFEVSAVLQDYAVGIGRRKAPGCLLPMCLLVLGHPNTSPCFVVLHLLMLLCFSMHACDMQVPGLPGG